MTLKLFRALWFLSVLVTLANLLYVYASLPSTVVVEANGEGPISKEWLFYAAMITIILINVPVYLLKMILPEGENLRSWFHGLLITFNVFFIIALQALNVFNSNEMFDHSVVPVYLTGSLVLIGLWAIAWPVYLAWQRIFLKQAV